MKSDRKETFLLLIIILVLSLGIGYAFISTTLSIDGVSDIDSSSWNIYWNNINVKDGSVTGTQVTTEPTINTNKTSVSFHINLKEPGEFYEFTVDAINDGSLDAMIDVIDKKVNNSSTIPEYINYTVTYEDDTDIERYQLLEANDSVKYKIRVEYRTDIAASSLPDTNQSLSLSFSVTYIQADSNAVRLYTNHYYFSQHFGIVNGTQTLVIGDNIQSLSGTFDSTAQAKNCAIRFSTKDDIIKKISFYIKRNNKEAFLYPGVLNFETNKAKFNYVFGESNCLTMSESYRCNTGDYYLLYFTGEIEYGNQSNYAKLDSNSVIFGQQPEG